MKVLIPSDSTQTFKIIPRVYSLSITLKLRDDSTNEVVTILTTATKVSNYLQIEDTFNLKENRFYDLKVYTGQGSVTDLDIIYKDKIFCTSQDIDQNDNAKYSVNKDEYVSKGGNNDYIII